MFDRKLSFPFYQVPLFSRSMSRRTRGEWTRTDDYIRSRNRRDYMEKERVVNTSTRSKLPKSDENKRVETSLNLTEHHSTDL